MFSQPLENKVCFPTIFPQIKRDFAKGMSKSKAGGHLINMLQVIIKLRWHMFDQRHLLLNQMRNIHTTLKSILGFFFKKIAFLFQAVCKKLRFNLVWKKVWADVQWTHGFDISTGIYEDMFKAVEELSILDDIQHISSHDGKWMVCDALIALEKNHEDTL